MKEETPAPHESDPAPKEDEPTTQPKAAKYVFKILPVDPKNSFDFEDVADK